MRASEEPIHVLYVGDEPAFVAAGLEREADGLDVETATSASKALARLADTRVDCVVAEHDRPVQDGMAFVEAVRDSSPDLPVVLYGAKGDDAGVHDVLPDGVTDSLSRRRDDDQYAVLATRIQDATEAGDAGLEEAVDGSGPDRSDRKSPLDPPDGSASADHSNGETRLDLFFEESPLGVVEWDAEFRVVRANATAAEILGSSDADLRGRSWAALVPDSEADELDEIVTDRDEDTMNAPTVTETLRADGERILCEWHHRVVRDAEGDVVTVFSQFQDVTDRERQQRRLETLVDNLPGMVYRCCNDPGWPMERVGGKVAELTGYPAAVIENNDVLFGTDVIHPEDQDDVWETVRDALDRREPFELTYRIVTKDDETKWVWERGQGLYADGEVEALEGFVTDITRRTEATRELRAEREFIDQALDALVDVFYVLDTDGRLQRWNSHVESVTGYSADELEGMHASELFPEVERARITEGIDRALDGDTVSVESGLLTAGGDRIPHELTAVRLMDDGNDVVGLVGVGRDITERRQYERRLSALHAVADDLTMVESVEEACRLTIEASQAVLEFDLSLITIEADGVLTPVAVSDDLSPDGMTEMSVEEGIAGKTYRTGESYLVDDVRSAPDANPQGPYRSVISVPLGGRGNFQAVSETPGAFDAADLELTELLLTHTENALDRIEREQRLADRNEQLHEFAGVVSHDLRNPLNVAQGHLDLVRDECGSEHLAPAADAIDRCFAIIDDVLTLAREGNRVRDPEPVDLAALAADCWSNVATAEATLVVESTRTVEADASQLTYVFENLLRNAVEHGGEEVTVTVGTLDGGFYVADDGEGIPEGDHEAVFEAGYSSRTDGTGFGLSIVREIAAAHDWQVQVTESDGGGARFEFTGVAQEA